MACVTLSRATFCLPRDNMDGRYHRTSRTDHQSDAGHQHLNRNNDIDRGNAFTPHTMPYEYAINSRYGRHAQHTEQSREKQFPKQDRNLYGSEVNRINFFLFHNFFLLVGRADK